MADFITQLRGVLADRQGPEAAALFQTLLKYVHRRVQILAHTRCEGLLMEADQEEVIAEVMFQMMSGGLARFRGECLPQLLAFVRTATDRIAWRVSERKIRERDAVERVTDDRDARWTPSTLRAPDQGTESVPDSPLPVEDLRYLSALLEAGSKADLARHAGVSRAAVTQRIQRIRDRISALSPRERAAHEAWLEHQASIAISMRSPINAAS